MSDNVQNEKSAFRLSYEKYRESLFTVSYEILNNSYLAEVSLEKMFHSAAKCFRKLYNSNIYDMGMFLEISARNSALEMNDHEEKADLLKTDIPKLKKDEISQILQSADLKNLSSALDSLEEKYRLVLAYKYVFGLKTKYIGFMLDTSKRKAKKYISNAENALCASLKNCETAHASDPDFPVEQKLRQALEEIIRKKNPQLNNHPKLEHVFSGGFEYSADKVISLEEKFFYPIIMTRTRVTMIIIALFLIALITVFALCEPLRDLVLEIIKI